jgi:hypothetical protein
LAKICLFFRPKIRKTSFGAQFYEKAVVGPLRRHYDDVHDRLRQQNGPE